MHFNYIFGFYFKNHLVLLSLKEGDDAGFSFGDDLLSTLLGGGGMPFGGLFGGFRSHRRGPRKGESTVHRLK